MKFNNTNDVKKWLRNIPFLKKNIELKIRFYQELKNEFKETPEFSKSVNYYKSEIVALNKDMKELMSDIDRLFGCLDENEKTVMTARYINLIGWDYIEFQVYYSRRQAIRIHNNALLKLVGQTVNYDSNL